MELPKTGEQLLQEEYLRVRTENIRAKLHEAQYNDWVKDFINRRVEEEGGNIWVSKYLKPEGI